MRFLVDADLPRSTNAIIQQYGHDAIDVRDVGLRSAPDHEIAQCARTHSLCIVTGDYDFANIRNYPPSEYTGIVVLSIPNNSTSIYINQVLDAFMQQEGLLRQLPGRLAVVEPGRVRLREG